MILPGKDRSQSMIKDREREGYDKSKATERVRDLQRVTDVLYSCLWFFRKWMERSESGI